MGDAGFDFLEELSLPVIFSIGAARRVEISWFPNADNHPIGDFVVLLTDILVSCELETGTANISVFTKFFIVDASSGAKSKELFGETESELFLCDRGSMDVGVPYLDVAMGFTNMGGDIDNVGTIKEVLSFVTDR